MGRSGRGKVLYWSQIYSCSGKLDAWTGEELQSRTQGDEYVLTHTHTYTEARTLIDTLRKRRTREHWDIEA